MTLDLNPEKLGALEALLFASPGPLPAQEAASLMGVEEEQVEALAQELAERYSGPDRGIELRQVAGGYQIFTHPRYARLVESLVEPERVRLSQAALETLALIAYRQPVTRATVEEVRGVSSSGVLKTLETAGLIQARRKLEAPGRPLEYVTTSAFLSYLGIKHLEDLPPLPQPEEHSDEEEETG